MMKVEEIINYIIGLILIVGMAVPLSAIVCIGLWKFLWMILSQ
jgi:hypothetical protein